MNAQVSPTVKTSVKALFLCILNFEPDVIREPQALLFQFLSDDRHLVVTMVIVALEPLADIIPDSFSVKQALDVSSHIFLSPSQL